MVYYFHAVAGAARGVDQRPAPDITVCTPSGNFGNLTAGLMAKRAGLPIARFVAATNVNDVVPEYLEHRARSRRAPRCRRLPTRWTSATRATSSGCSGCIATTSRRCAATSPAAGTRDDEVRETIKRVYETRGYLLDPHCAIALHGAEGTSSGRRRRQGRSASFSRPRIRRSSARSSSRSSAAAIETPAPLAEALARAAARPADRRVARRGRRGASWLTTPIRSGQATVPLSRRRPRGAPGHGILPTPRTPPELVRDYVRDLYKWEIRRLRERYLSREFPKAEYWQRVDNLRRRYPVLALLPRQFVV